MVTRSKIDMKRVLLPAFLLFVLVMGGLSYLLFQQYIIVQAEKRVESVLYESVALHHYVQKCMHPVMYELKESGRLPKEFYAPEMLSSSYIARHMFQLFNEQRKMAGLPPVTYRIASENPRNSVNQASEREAELIRMFNQDRSKKSFHQIVHDSGNHYLLYAQPFLEVKPACLKCHGRPEDTPIELRQAYNWTGGYGLKVGDIIAVETIESPLASDLKASQLFLIGTIGVVLTLGVLALLNFKLASSVQDKSRELLESRHSLLVAQNIARLGNWRYDKTRDEFMISDIFADILGDKSLGNHVISLEDFIDHVLCEDQHLVRQHFKDSLDQVADELEFRIVNQKNSEIRILHLTSRLLDDNQNEQRLTGAVQDITERVMAGQERERLISDLEARNRQLEQYAYSISHDLKTPLVTIEGFVGFLEKNLAEGDLEQAAVSMEHIRRSSHQINDLLQDLLHLTEIGQMEITFERVNLEKLMRNTIDRCHAQINARGIQLLVDDNLPVIQGNVRVLSLLFDNLIENAIKFMGEQQNPAIHIGCEILDERVLITVGDNGIGIPEVYRERIFRLFEKLDVRSLGTGIGLTMARRIVELHHGRIWVESNNPGSVFYIELPLSAHAGVYSDTPVETA